MGFSIYYYDKSGRRYEGRVRICDKCKKEEIVRATNECTTCQDCARPKVDYEISYIDSNGKKYPGRKRKCVDCGKQEIKRLSNKSIYCRDCSQKHKKSGIKLNELFVLRKKGTEKARAKVEKCSNCGIERIVRIDSKYKSSLCRKCLSSEKGKMYGKIYGPLSRIDGRSCFRKEAFKYFKEECSFCKKNIRIDVHHIDKNRCNNVISNLIPLCPSCHKSVHWQIRKGKSNNEALEFVKNKKLIKNPGN